MEGTHAPKLRKWWLIGPFFLCICFPVSCFSGLRLEAYPIYISPEPREVLMSSGSVEFWKMDETNSWYFDLHGWVGSHWLKVTFKNGTERELILYPRPFDDNSSTFEITDKYIKSHGDLRYKVIR